MGNNSANRIKAKCVPSQAATRDTWHKVAKAYIQWGALSSMRFNIYHCHHEHSTLESIWTCPQTTRWDPGSISNAWISTAKEWKEEKGGLQRDEQQQRFLLFYLMNIIPTNRQRKRRVIEMQVTQKECLNTAKSPTLLLKSYASVHKIEKSGERSLTTQCKRDT